MWVSKQNSQICTEGIEMCTVRFLDGEFSPFVFELSEPGHCAHLSAFDALTSPLISRKDAIIDVIKCGVQQKKKKCASGQSE